MHAGSLCYVKGVLLRLNMDCVFTKTELKMGLGVREHEDSRFLRSLSVVLHGVGTGKTITSTSVATLAEKVG